MEMLARCGTYEEDIFTSHLEKSSSHVEYPTGLVENPAREEEFSPGEFCPSPPYDWLSASGLCRIRQHRVL